MNTNSEETTRQNSPATTNSSNKATSARRVYKPEPKNRASPAQEDLDEIVIDFNNKSSDDHDDEDSPPPNLSRNTKHQQSQNLAKRKRLGVGRYSASLKHL
ncbi:hypothetical protein CU098_008228 [Rhizopus stolonifer]|uniref:Uncharacterized protein n=1 Tax=Rhizopus stolonifer TaxID=4846 RepID=A0A367JSA8_RHIST|nr:hypothetical protein CU098_008228 [Rhizopus stolonifer]